MKKIFLLLTLVSISYQSYGVEMILTERKRKAEEKKSQYLQHLKELDKYFTTKRLGSFVENGQTFFRLFAPSAEKVILTTFLQPEDEIGNEYELIKDSSGVWGTALKGEHYGLYYGFKVHNPGDDERKKKLICLDPYAKAVTTFNTYLNPRRAIVVNENDYDWEGDTWIQRDWRDLIIYEMHVRDMTAHSSSGANFPGTYSALAEKGIKGGIDYINSLGINTVELLPSQEFANIEIPYEDSLLGRMNTWNVYERNHWGYMTAAFFAPEAYYAENWKSFKWDVWEGKDGKQIHKFKDMVKAFHNEGIAVIMDVVFNHLSEYEYGNLKEIDKDYYFRLDENGNFISHSYCGNDLKTERPMVRRMIVESILYWMKEYHIDGFRFDLGKLIDWQTIEEIIYEAQKINPNVIFVCEPWGGGYDPKGFSLRGWGAWNDQIRNGVKGENPKNGHGWIFGKWYGNNNRNRIKSYLKGTLVTDEHGLFQKKEHSVNYLEAHDGYTLGDFIRVGLHEAKENKVIKDVESFVKLTDEQLKLNKLAALFLFCSQGIVMIHSGQEFARTKIVDQNTHQKDKHKGMIDHNSYEKDNETNYINYKHAEINRELLDYYKGLIKIRNSFSVFRRANENDFIFHEPTKNEFALGVKIMHESQEFIFLFNADRKKTEIFSLPEGNWQVLADENSAGQELLREVKGEYKVPHSAGAILKKKTD